jgi:hypothetical protein
MSRFSNGPQLLRAYWQQGPDRGSQAHSYLFGGGPLVVEYTRMGSGQLLNLTVRREDGRRWSAPLPLQPGTRARQLVEHLGLVR